jgi:hypothetical protein
LRGRKWQATEKTIMRSSKIFALHRILRRYSVFIVGIGCNLQGFRFLSGQRDFSVFVTHSWLWLSPTLVFSGFRRLFPGDGVAWAWEWSVTYIQRRGW